jgi:hypothetical protein
MHQAGIIVLLVTAVGVLAVLARKITLPYPIVFVLGGLVLSFVPRLPAKSSPDTDIPPRDDYLAAGSLFGWRQLAPFFIPVGRRE